MSVGDDSLASRLMFTVHQDLPREGPGNRESTARALAAVRNLPAQPAVLDVGAGPGMQTMDLAELLPGARISAIDAHLPFVTELRARAQAAGVSDRVSGAVGDMRALPFEAGRFDLIWCEGAAYIMGVAAALNAWRPLLKPGGTVALTDAVWLTESPPQTLADWWASGYPEMGDVQTCLNRMTDAGFALRDHFVLPAAAWWDDYYKPMEARLASLRVEFEADRTALAALEEHQREIDYFRRWSDHYSYLFMIGERVD